MLVRRLELIFFCHLPFAQISSSITEPRIVMCKCLRARLPNSEAQITYIRDIFALQNDDSSSLYTISCPLDGLIMDCLAPFVVHDVQLVHDAV